MSIPEIKRFVADCRSNPDMARQVADAGTDLGAVVGVANRLGYQFTAEDAAAALAQTQLNESQMGQVAGGDGGAPANIVASNASGLTTTNISPGLLVSQVVDIAQVSTGVAVVVT